MTLRHHIAAACLLAAVALTPPAAAQYEPGRDGTAGLTFGDLLVLNQKEPGICAALAAGLAEHATESFIPDREPALAARVFAAAPARFEDLECSVSFFRDLLDCIVTRYAVLRRALLSDRVTVEEARLLHRERALACAAKGAY